MRVGVVGCGYWGAKHIRVLQSLTEVERVAVIDVREETRNELCRGFPATRSLPDLASALPHIDAVIIATPPSTHAELALQALDAGKHVLIEKPMATSVSDARRIIDAARTAGRVLMAGHTYEYNPAVWKLRDTIASHELGAVRYIDSARLSLGLYQRDVNVIWDLAPHDISIINCILQSTPDRVQVWGSRHAHDRLEDVAYILLEYLKIGVAAQIHVSWLDPCKVRRLTVVGSEKMAVYNDVAADERLRIYDKGVASAPTDEAMGGLPMSYRYGSIVTPFIAFREPLRIEDQHFVECISHGRTPKTDGWKGLAVVEVLESIDRALREGRPVGLNEASPGSQARDALLPR